MSPRAPISPRLASLIWIVAALFTCAGCAAHTPALARGARADGPSGARPGGAIGARTVATSAPAMGAPSQGPVTGPSTAPQNLERLVSLQARRHAETGARDYVLGPGDVLAIRAFDFDELNQQVRVEGNGTITLPLLNTVVVAGRTVAEVQQDLTARLGDYMYDPHVSIFVQEYRSEQVAVVGAVQRPGLVKQMGTRLTVLDALAEAGGMTADAGSRIYLIPAETRVQPEVQALAIAASGNDPSITDGTGLRDALPIMVDTKEVTQEAQRLFYSLPMRGGDVIVVPRTGHFIAEGWVEKPGTYPLQSGLTLRGALAIAGGLSFPAATSNIRVFRAQASDNAELHKVNYRAIAAQKIPDFPIQEGDVIEVASSKVMLVPYGFYKVMFDLLHFGARVPLIP